MKETVKVVWDEIKAGGFTWDNIKFICSLPIVIIQTVYEHLTSRG